MVGVAGVGSTLWLVFNVYGEGGGVVRFFLLDSRVRGLAFLLSAPFFCLLFAVENVCTASVHPLMQPSITPTPPLLIPTSLHPHWLLKVAEAAPASNGDADAADTEKETESPAAADCVEPGAAEVAAKEADKEGEGGGEEEKAAEVVEDKAGAEEAKDGAKEE